MNTAVIIGHGPEVAALARFHAPFKNLIPFRTNLSPYPHETAHFPALHLDKPDSAREELRSRNVKSVVMVGSFVLASADLEEGPPLMRLAQWIGAGNNISDSIKQYIHAELGAAFDFPAARWVLPFLFVDDDGVNQKPDLLARALAATASSGCATLNLDGEAARIFRVTAAGQANLFNCCLGPEKLFDLHQNKAVKRFFFDRNRTIVLDYNDMTAYARVHGLTIQSFIQQASVDR